MTSNILIQCAFYLVALLALAKPLGEFFARVLAGEPTFLRAGARLAGTAHLPRLRRGRDSARCAGPSTPSPRCCSTWPACSPSTRCSASSTCCRSTRPGLGAVSPDSSWNTAVSFATNTNWQGYGGESTMSYLTQMLVLAVQNFVSAATGIAVLAALARAFSRKQSGTIGNFWADLTRSTLYILLPLSLLLALALVSQGVVQTFKPYVTAQTVEKIRVRRSEEGPDGKP